MIDENLPTFFLKNNPQSPQQSTIYHRQNGNEPAPAYTLRRLDPASPSSENHYGVALYDPWVPGIVFGEVSVKPEWTQPSLSAETIRANGGAAPPPEPIIPNEFTIQLYNPDQQIIVHHKAKTWNRPARWEFEMPQRTFRVPSASTLDRTQSDPATADVTPKLKFSWRKDGKLSKDLSCLLHGKTSTVPETKNKSREPDITVALFQGLKELTLYEPNLYRVEMEDFKGLEVVLLLAAVAIRDVFFGAAKEVFNIKATSPGGTVPGRKSPKTQAQGAQPGTAPNRRPSPPRLSIPTSSAPAPQPQTRKDKEAEEESRRTQDLLAQEKRQREQARRQRQQEVDQETKRLQEIYGQEEQQVRMQTPAPSSRPNLPPRHSEPARPQPQPHHRYSQSYSYIPQNQPAPPRHSRPQYQQAGAPYGNSPYLRVNGSVDPRAQSTASFGPPRPRPQSTVGFYQVPASSGALPPGKPVPQQASPQQQLQPKKSSFFGFRRNKEEAAPGKKLDKKRSSMF